MTGFDQIVVALGSPDSDSSLIQYAALLSRLGAAKEVRFAHVADAEASSPDLRIRMRQAVAPAFAGVNATIECDVLHGSLTDRLLAYVTEFQADLILIGANKRKLGARLAMVAPCSVGVIPNDTPATLSHLMVALDFSDSAADTLQWATSLAAGDRSIRCTALHVVTHESTDLFTGYGDDEAAQAEAMKQLLARTNHHQVPVHSLLTDVSRSADVGRSHPLSLPAAIEGIDVAQTILSEAERCDADCIALSTRGRSRSASILLGSVAEKVIERATVPLLVGKRHGSNLGLATILLGHAGRHSDFKTN